MAGMADKIVIAPEELASSEVDEALARQLSFGMAPAPERVEERPTGFFYRAYVALSLAGLLGGLSGWAVLEPFVTEGVEFASVVELVSPGYHTPSGQQLTLVRIGMVQVWVSPWSTRVERDGEVVAVETLATGQVVRVKGRVIGEGAERSVSAYEVIQLPEGSRDARLGVNLPEAERRATMTRLLVFAVIAAFIGLFIGAADGLLSRAFHRAAVCGAVGMGMGLVVGLMVTLPAEVAYGLGARLVEGMGEPNEQGMTTAQLLVQMSVRGLAWALAGAAMGLGQGVALRSSKLLVNGLVGGMVGALIGGLLFDPINVLFDTGGEAWLSRGVGFGVIGFVTGLMTGLVELAAREAWIKMLTGPLAGKEFVLFKSPTTVGSSPKSDVYLFKDPEVEPSHALIHALGEGYELEDRDSPTGTYVNGRRVSRERLVSGDQVRIGKTVFVLRLKED
ncbi:FHA domain-containing protein [Myxococcus sp. K38C18041901]|uniref:FHA domain-containing protein n=1 Tax=Myxococcus guangdongensis TaxID=2906760 RepID=UPI0020A768BE|nr:FHA domain-containing protein [Myxococcus guangdongensis]MCP3065060.1 FHA domain-containing protein [Myxococcus guangdongensis]